MGLMLRSAFIVVLLLAAMPVQAIAAGSVWYEDGDPLSTSLELPPKIYGAGLKPEVAGQSCAGLDFSKALTLADVTEAALCNNPQTRESYANAKVQAAQLGIAKSAFLPTLTDSVGINQNFVNPESASRGREFVNLNNNLAVSYLLYDFGNRNAALENARQLLNAVSATQSAVVQNLLLSTVKAYYQVQSDIAALEASKEAERFNLESFKAAEAKYKAGVSTPADKLQAETAYAQAMLNRISAEGALKTDYGILANVMGMNANMTLNLVRSVSSPVNTSEIERDIHQLIEYARVRRPDLMASEAQLSAAKANIEASRAAAKPTVSVGLSNSFQDGSSLSSSNNSALGLTVTVPIFTGYAPTYRIRSAEANAEVREAQRDQLKLQISLDVWTAFQNLRTAHEAIISSEVLVRSATESALVALGRYKAGVGNIIEALNAQTAFASANQQKIKADLNRNIARAALAQAIGTLDSVMIQTLPDGGQPLTEANF
jgi:TolC family type I secretion outer membrane protein